jgi:23S rRNA pseudouridine1911/1915/1917 synthase
MVDSNVIDSKKNAPQTLTVRGDDAGTRLDVFVARAKKVSRERAKKLLQDATIGGAPVKTSHVLKAGEEVVLSAEIPAQSTETQTEKSPFPFPTFQLPIIYEDEHLIVVNKPRGLVVHEGAGETGSTLVEILREQGTPLSSFGAPERAGIVHRLDKDTTGVMAVCKTDAAHQKLAADFAERGVHKQYTALVCGVPRNPGRIEAPVERHPKNRIKMAISPSGKMAITEYFPSQSWDRFSLLDVRILTGRTHQIRVHLAYLNYPVVGDNVYGGFHRALENAPNEATKIAIQNLHGQALHAAHLSFSHPVTNEKMSFHAPLPDEMSQIIAALNEAPV